MQGHAKQPIWKITKDETKKKLTDVDPFKSFEDRFIQDKEHTP